MSVDRKIAIVTGGSQGIGRAVAEKLAEKGMCVLIGYIGDHTEAENTIKTIEAKGGIASSFYGDISKLDNIKKIFSICIERYGNPDILVANAGYSKMIPFMEITEKDYYDLFDVNVKGTLFCVQEAGRKMNDNGSIIVVSSSSVRYPVIGMGVYSPSKSALHSLVEVASMELAHRGITINSVLPGVTATKNAIKELPTDFVKTVSEATPFGRIGEPEDVADVIVSLTCKESRWITGQHITANGGGKF